MLRCNGCSILQHGRLADNVVNRRLYFQSLIRIIRTLHDHCQVIVYSLRQTNSIIIVIIDQQVTVTAPALYLACKCFCIAGWQADISCY